MKAVHVGGRRIARRTGVHDKDVAAGSRQNQCRARARAAAADDHDVVVTHALRLWLRGLFTYESCYLWVMGVS